MADGICEVYEPHAADEPVRLADSIVLDWYIE
jgi:hypothetical protein